MHLRHHLPMARRVIGDGVSILIDIICTLSHSHLDVVEFFVVVVVVKIERVVCDRVCVLVVKTERSVCDPLTINRGEMHRQKLQMFSPLILVAKEGEPHSAKIRIVRACGDGVLGPHFR